MTILEVFGVLLSWASHLSGYPMAQLPDVQYKPHEFFVENVCGGKECNVLGWYNDDSVVYIDEKHENGDGFSDSLIVHEFVHYLQDLSGKFNESCSDFITREQEAYEVQNRYLTQATTIIEFVGSLKKGCRK